MPTSIQLQPCLWFDTEAEEAAVFYVSVFPDSKIHRVVRYGEEGREIHGKPEGSVMVVEFQINGESFTALNGGPAFTFNEAVSFQVLCDTQEEVDYYWEKLGEGGDERAQQCGWLKDPYGLSWQVIPRALFDLVGDPSSEASQRTTKAMLQMKKLDIGELRRVHDGRESA